MNKPLCEIDLWTEFRQGMMWKREFRSIRNVEKFSVWAMWEIDERRGDYLTTFLLKTRKFSFSKPQLLDLCFSKNISFAKITKYSILVPKKPLFCLKAVTLGTSIASHNPLPTFLLIICCAKVEASDASKDYGRRIINFLC